MYCEVCGQSGGFHRDGCPEAHINEHTIYTCCDCGEGIFVDEEYVENFYGDKMHYDCTYNMTTRQLLNWIGVDIQRAKDEEF